jgi:hypothetical protein
MQSEIRDIEFVALAVFEEGSGVAGADLTQQHFDEEVGIDKQSHWPSLLQRAMRCRNSMEVYLSRKPWSAPAQANCGLSGCSMERRASKDST